LKEIYLLRHGRTEYNAKGMVQGSGIDADLDNVGSEQALAFYNAYNHIRFDHIYISALKRTYQTVEKFIEAGIPYTKYEGLNEISWGNMEGLSANVLDKQHYLDTITAWKNGELHRAIGFGESPLEVVERQRPVIQEIIAAGGQDVIIICMHGRAMRILLSTLMNNPLSEMEMYEHANTGLYHLLYENDKFSILKDNCQLHLG